MNGKHPGAGGREDGRRRDDSRVVLGLWHEAVDAASVRAAAELAHQLSLGLHGVFVEDEALLAMAALPFAREIRLTTHTWSPLSADTIEAEMRTAAHQAQRLLDEAARASGIVSAFEIVRGDPAACIAAICRAGDVLVVRQETASALPAPEAAADCSVLLLPARPAARRGAAGQGGVVALLADAADRALETAIGLAAATGEDLTILLAAGTPPPAARAVVARARDAGLLHQRIIARTVRAHDAQAWLDAMGATRERLVVLARSSPLAGAASLFAATRGVPVLLVGEAPASGAAAGAG